jgi:hypothetical protein
MNPIWDWYAAQGYIPHVLANEQILWYRPQQAEQDNEIN